MSGVSILRILRVLEVLAFLCVLGILVILCVLKVLVLLCVLEVLVLQCVLQLFLQQICKDQRLLSQDYLFLLRWVYGELSVKSSISCFKIILFFYNGYMESCL